MSENDSISNNRYANYDEQPVEYNSRVPKSYQSLRMSSDFATRSNRRPNDYDPKRNYHAQEDKVKIENYGRPIGDKSSINNYDSNRNYHGQNDEVKMKRDGTENFGRPVGQSSVFPTVQRKRHNQNDVYKKVDLPSGGSKRSYVPTPFRSKNSNEGPIRIRASNAESSGREEILDIPEESGNFRNEGNGNKNYVENNENYNRNEEENYQENNRYESQTIPNERNYNKVQNQNLVKNRNQAPFPLTPQKRGAYERDYYSERKKNLSEQRSLSVIKRSNYGLNEYSIYQKDYCGAPENYKQDIYDFLVTPIKGEYSIYQRDYCGAPDTEMKKKDDMPEIILTPVKGEYSIYQKDYCGAPDSLYNNKENLDNVLVTPIKGEYSIYQKDYCGAPESYLFNKNDLKIPHVYINKDKFSTYQRDYCRDEDKYYYLYDEGRGNIRANDYINHNRRHRRVNSHY